MIWLWLFIALIIILILVDISKKLGRIIELLEPNERKFTNKEIEKELLERQNSEK